MCTTFDETVGELRVTQAYIELLSIPEKRSGTRMVPVARTESYEIRMLRFSEDGFNSEPAIWMVLVELGTQLLLDSGRCSEIEGALVVFKEFITQVKTV